MAKITVTAKIDGGVHLKYGEIVKGKQYAIEEEDFGEQLFERPPGFESPHDKAAREQREAKTAADNPQTPVPSPTIIEKQKQADVQQQMASGDEKRGDQ